MFIQPWKTAQEMQILIPSQYGQGQSEKKKVNSSWFLYYHSIKAQNLHQSKSPLSDANLPLNVNIVKQEVWKGEFQFLLILCLISMYFDAVAVKKNLFLFKLALAILCRINFMSTQSTVLKRQNLARFLVLFFHLPGIIG